jgi:hypothetical protein
VPELADGFWACGSGESADPVTEALKEGSFLEDVGRHVNAEILVAKWEAVNPGKARDAMGVFSEEEKVEGIMNLSVSAKAK